MDIFSQAPSGARTWASEEFRVREGKVKGSYGLFLMGLAGLLCHSAVRADAGVDDCAYRPFVGVCAQGCDVDDKEPPTAGIAMHAEPLLVAAQTDCDRTPYLSPLCEDGLWPLPR